MAAADRMRTWLLVSLFLMASWLEARLVASPRKPRNYTTAMLAGFAGPQP